MYNINSKQPRVADYFDCNTILYTQFIFVIKPDVFLCKYFIVPLNELPVRRYGNIHFRFWWAPL